MDPLRHPSLFDEESSGEVPAAIPPHAPLLWRNRTLRCQFAIVGHRLWNHGRRPLNVHGAEHQSGDVLDDARMVVEWIEQLVDAGK